MKVAEPRRATIVLGTRPEAVKLAPVVHALEASPDWEVSVIISAQHRSMLDPLLETFAIRADIDLDVFAPGLSLTDITSRVLTGLSKCITKNSPDVVIVQGDTTTTFATALAAFYAGLPVAHVEAGLRTGNKRLPFPEEMNRALTTQIASLHFAPTASSRANLLREGVAASDVFVTGNTVIDALLWAVDQPLRQPEPALERIGRDGRRVLLVTAHRRESWGEPMAEIARAIARLAAAEPDLDIVVPAHLNPIVRDTLASSLDGRPTVLITPPLPYLSFVHLLARCDLTLTDSGGVQEEAPSLGKPVLVMRATTERPEGVEAGCARIVGTDEDAIVSTVGELLHDDGLYQSMARAVNPYGDGHAAPRILAGLDAHFRGGTLPSEFRPDDGGPSS